MYDQTDTTTEVIPPLDPADGVYFEGEPLPPARQHGPVAEDPAARHPNRDRRGRPIPSHDDRYQWPQMAAAVRSRNEPCIPGPCLPGTDGEYISATGPEADPEPAEETEEPASPAMP